LSKAFFMTQTSHRTTHSIPSTEGGVMGLCKQILLLHRHRWPVVRKIVPHCHPRVRQFSQGKGAQGHARHSGTNFMNSLGSSSKKLCETQTSSWTASKFPSNSADVMELHNIFFLYAPGAGIPSGECMCV